MTKLLLLAALAASVTACEKAAPSGPKGSGALTTVEGDLLGRLPAGANIVFGGNLFDMQKRLADSALGKIAAKTNPPELTAWNNCLGSKNMTMVGTVAFAGDGLKLHMFFRGVTLAEMEQCARTAGMPVTADADGKFITVVTTNQGITATMPYLTAGDGVYGVVKMGGLGSMAAGGKPEIAETTRADLERDVASLAQGTAATDPKITALLAKVDRSKMIWFAGSAADTPLADKLVLGYGSFTIDGGFTADVTIQPRDMRDAERAISEFSKARSQLNSLPAGMGALKDAIRSIKLNKTADGVRIQFSITDAQIESIMEVAGPMMGGM